MFFRTYFVPVVLVAAALLAVSCQNPKAQIEFVSPKNGDRVFPASVPVYVRWTGQDCVADTIKLFIQGSTFPGMAMSPMPETVSWFWYPSNIPNGTEKWLVTQLCYHGVGNSVPRVMWDSVQVTVDSSGPVVRFVSPQDGDTLKKGDIPLVVWAVDSGRSGMNRVEFLVDDVREGTVTSGIRDTWRYTWDASTAGAGGHSLKARAYDNVGVMAAAEVDITIRDTTSGGGPTYHHGYVFVDETWSPAGNPHIVDGDVVFRSGARLTIEPGCIVRFDDFSLGIGTIDSSGLVAVGTVSAPILFTSNRPVPAPGDWVGIRFGSDVLPGTRLGHCTIEYAGPTVHAGSAIYMGGGGIVQEFSNCIIRNGGMYGIYCQEYAGFGAFSNNQVTANKSYALRVDAGRAGLLGDGNDLTGNDSAGVELYGRLRNTMTWPDLGVPYVIQDVSVGDSTNNPVLTIQPGTGIRFKNTGVLQVGKVGASLPARIIADGSAGRIKFTSPNPAPGGFYGVNVYGNLIGESEFKNCEFSYGGQGGAGLLSVVKCGPTITGCDFGHSAGWGIIFQTLQMPDTVALKQVNTFHDNALGNIRWTPALPGD